VISRWGLGRICAVAECVVVLVASGIIAAGCAAYRPRPIEPAQVEEQFRARSLSDPGLRDFIGTRLGEPPMWPPRAWRLAMLTLAAFYYHPDLEVARTRLATAEAGIVTAGARPNPSVGLTVRYDINPMGLPSPWTIPFTFDIPIETAGKRGIRILRAERLTGAARFGLAQAMWQVRSGVRGALLDHLLARSELGLLREEEAVRMDAVRVFERRLSAGDVSRPDVDAARIGLADTRLALRGAAGRVEETRVALAAALGLPVAALDGVPLAWPELEHPPDPDKLQPSSIQRAALLNRLDLQQGLAQYEAAEAALKLEVAKQYPDVRLGPGYVFEEGINKFQIGVSITLPILNRNEGPIAEAEARRQEVAATFSTLQQRVIAETGKALTRYDAAAAELADAETALGLVRQREAAVDRALELGEEDRVTLVGVQLERVAAARARLAALRGTQVALGALEDSMERPLEMFMK
jgi:cobalt-zinc-cadmium efflux system outer membrane protein